MSVRRALALFLLASSASAASITQPMKDVERIRTLRFTGPVKTAAIDRKEIPDRVREQMLRDLPYPIDDYVLVLKSLQLVDGDTSALTSSFFELLEGQVLAYYDPREHVYFAVRQPPDAMKDLANAETLEQSVAVHELTHALQDQRYGIGAHDETLRKDSDAGLAYHSLIEGEASLVMMAWMIDKAGKPYDEVLHNGMIGSLLVSAAASDKTIAPGVPRYFVESLKFPYVQGLGFVVDAYQRGGWKEMDRVYADPPRSTREVLHSDEYFARLDGKGTVAAPHFKDDPPFPVPGLLSVEHLGEFTLGYLVGPSHVRGWIDDRATIVQNAACETTTLVETRWESADRARDFAEAYNAFLDDRGVAHRIARNGNDVKTAYGADAALVARFIGP